MDKFWQNLYHSRWGIEELYKVSKLFIDAEDFHSQTERTVKQELYGHLLLINIARIFEYDSNARLLPVHKNNKIHAIIGRNLENLILASTPLLNTWLHTTMKSATEIKMELIWCGVS